jgi:transcriptional regulator with XRE-family HTH domain
MPKKSVARKKYGMYGGTEPPIRRTFRQNLRALRLAKRWTGKELGEKLGVSQPYISELENPNMPATPDLSTLELIASTFQIPPHSLLIDGFYNGGVSLDHIYDLSRAELDSLQSVLEITVARAKRQ